MIERFRGEHGRRLLIDALLRQGLVNGQRDIAEAIAAKAALKQFAPGEKLITQGGADNELYLLLSGDVTIEVNGRLVAQRRGGEHLGEMALADPGGSRTATVIAKSATVAAILSEPDFTAIADEHPRLWRLLAVELVDRFRRRAVALRAPNPEPRVFIGSSVEGLPVAKAIQSGLRHVKALVEIWPQNVFEASKGTIEVLEAKAAEIDFAVLVLTADDVARIRAKAGNAARDNVIFELGLFMGELGRPRTCMIGPRGADLGIPTDLLGITPLAYRPGGLDELAARVGPVCTDLEELIRTYGPK
jgi:CRP/FNR family transcriptional regulator, cyclic AMP receptor protein